MHQYQFPRIVASFCSSATEFLQIVNVHSDEPVRYLLSKMRLAVTSQQWQNTIPQEHQVPILGFFHSHLANWHKGQLRPQMVGLVVRRKSLESL